MIQSSGTRPSPVSRQPTIGRLFRNLAVDSRTLLQQEIELAKTEMSEKASTFGRNVVYAVIGGAVLYAGLIAIIAAACIGVGIALAKGMDPEVAMWLGPLLVGVVVAIIGYAFVQTAINAFKRESLAPRQSIASLREDTEWLKDQMTTHERN